MSIFKSAQNPHYYMLNYIECWFPFFKTSRLIKFKLLYFCIYILRIYTNSNWLKVLHPSARLHGYFYSILMVAIIRAMIKRWEWKRDHIISIEAMFAECIITLQFHFFLSLSLSPFPLFLPHQRSFSVLRLIKQFGRLFTIASNERKFLRSPSVL